MILSPSIAEKLSRAQADLRMGLPIVLTAPNTSGGPNTSDGQSAVIISIETLTQSRLTALRAIGQPHICLTARRALTLKATAYDGDLAQIALPADRDLGWLRGLADPADDLEKPFKGPLSPLRASGPQAQDAAGIARAGLALLKRAHLLPAALIIPLTLSAGQALAQTHTLGLIPLADASRRLLESPDAGLAPVISAALPMMATAAGRVHVFRPTGGGDEHYAVEIGQPDRATPVLTRLHSACFTGDVIGSLKCDCGAQLKTALHQMGNEGAGILLYLNQEGRGIGLANKMRAYSLQNQGFDTVEANHRLGFEDDERNFQIGTDILRQMGFKAVRLMTNNPHKISSFARHGLHVAERVPLITGHTKENIDYLAVKARKSGHLF